MANEPRLREALQIYRDAGYEVYLEPLPEMSTCETCGDTEKEGAECRACFEGFEAQYKTIFTRPREGGTDREDELF